jgi:type I restriction enzyme M protein
MEDTQAYAEWKKGVNDSVATEVDALKYASSEAYEVALRKHIDDYDIFMAIAEDIGYDATGKPTKTNELDAIGDALRTFISEVEVAE